MADVLALVKRTAHTTMGVTHDGTPNRKLLGIVTSRDYPVIMGVAVLICGVVLVANLILDLIYAALDPRIKFK